MGDWDVIALAANNNNRARRRLPGGGYVSFGKSINWDECLTDSSHVRAALHLVGAICRSVAVCRACRVVSCALVVDLSMADSRRPIPGEPNRCMLTRIAQLDPKVFSPSLSANTHTLPSAHDRRNY
jgi:hypothetical protein